MSENLIKESTCAINKAAKILNRGGLVSVKAETVYGLACDPSNPDAILKLYNLKNRPSSNPLIIHVNSLDMLKDIAEINAKASSIINFFWPGPLTLILPRKMINHLSLHALLSLLEFEEFLISLLIVH